MAEAHKLIPFQRTSKFQHDVLSIISQGWVIEHTIKVNQGSKKGGLPTYYNIDIAHPQLKIAIEVDGRQHRANFQKKVDLRRDEFLTSLGWKVIRILNKDILNLKNDVP